MISSLIYNDHMPSYEIMICSADALLTKEDEEEQPQKP
jgi:hypothetical protein